MAEFITADEAIAAVTAAAWTVPVHRETCPDCGHRFASTHPREPDNAGETLIHTQAGPFGADWTLESAVEFLRTATRVGWARSIVGHDLIAEGPDGDRVRTVRFDVPHPDSRDRR